MLDEIPETDHKWLLMSPAARSREKKNHLMWGKMQWMIWIAIRTERGDAWHQVGKEAQFSLVEDPGKKEGGGSTFPDCFPIPSGYYAAKFVGNSPVNERLFRAWIHIEAALFI